MQYIKDSIDDETLGEVRYFQQRSSDGAIKFQGSLFCVPRTIIAVDRQTVLKLARLWLNKDMQALALHPIQYYILAQLEEQLNTFISYAKQQHKTRVIRTLEEILIIVQNIYETKRNLSKNNPAYIPIKIDPIQKALKEALHATFAEPSSSIFRA